MALRKILTEGDEQLLKHSRKVEKFDDRLHTLIDDMRETLENSGGRVWVDVQQVADHVVLRVKDTGIGIPAAEQGRIFERFYRVDKSHSKAVGGTGLGLSIVKHGAALHHATISVSSEPEQGTEITLTFPAA